MHHVGLPFLLNLCRIVLQGQVRESRIKHNIVAALLTVLLSFHGFRWQWLTPNRRVAFLEPLFLAQNNGYKGQTAPLSDQGPLWEGVSLHELLAGQRGLQSAHSEILQLQWDTEGIWSRHQDALWKSSVWPGAQGVRWVSKTRYV